MADVLLFAPGVDHHFTGWSVDGSVSNRIVLDSSDYATPHTLIADSGGPFTSTYLDIARSHASPGASWTADATCLDLGDNQAWFAVDSVAGDVILFAAGTTQHFTGWSVNGSPSNVPFVASYPPGSAHYLVADSGGPFTSDYVRIQWSEASPDDQWSAGAHAVDDGNNVGWWVYTVYADAVGVELYTLIVAALAQASTAGISASSDADAVPQISVVPTDAVASSATIEFRPIDATIDSDIGAADVLADVQHSDTQSSVDARSASALAETTQATTQTSTASISASATLDTAEQETVLFLYAYAAIVVAELALVEGIAVPDVSEISVQLDGKTPETQSTIEASSAVVGSGTAAQDSVLPVDAGNVGIASGYGALYAVSVPDVRSAIVRFDGQHPSTHTTTSAMSAFVVVAMRRLLAILVKRIHSVLETAESVAVVPAPARIHSVLSKSESVATLPAPVRVHAVLTEDEIDD